MDKIINNNFANAQLSMAAYATLSVSMNANLDDYKDALLAENFSDKQAEDFTETYEVVDQRTDPISGFSGTVFRNKETGKYTLALRGTERGDLNDIIRADLLGIALDGQAQAQINAMNAWFGSLVTPESLGGLGVLDQDIKLDIAGHSLGGHLATFFTIFWRDHVNHSYTYNGAGTGDDDQGALIVQLREILGLESSEPIPDSLITNLFAEPGLEVTAGLGVVFGESIPLFIEDQGVVAGNLFFGNHGILHLTDAMAVYDLLGQVDPAKSTGQILSLGRDILEAASNQAETSLEEVVNGLGKIFRAGVNVAVDDRDQLYTSISAIREAIADRDSLQLVSLVRVDADDIQARAAANSDEGLAYRHALQNLLPFTVLGDATLYDGEALAANHFSQDYLADRAEYLANKIALAVDDLPTAPGGIDPRVYEDLALGEDATVSFNFQGAGPRPDLADRHIIFTSSRAGQTAEATGGVRGDRLYGFLGDDTLDGGKGADRLEGGSGDDTLHGVEPGGRIAQRSDTLRGGAGMDTYYAGRSDIINDSDGEGRIFLPDDTEVSNRTFTLEPGSDAIYGDDELRVRLQTQPDGTQSLLILGVTPVTVHNFQRERNDFGIQLNDDTPELARTLLLGTEGDDGLSELSGTDGDDEIRALAGNDRAFGGTGSDRILGGDGDDILGGGNGNDELSGEAGRDVLSGGNGNDSLNGGEGTDVLLGDAGDDVLNGGQGIDLLIGGEDRNVLSGGEDADLLIAHGNATIGSDWQFTLDDQGQFIRTGIDLDPGMVVSNYYVPTGSTGGSLFGEGGNDLLIGSNANDLLDGGDGNDVIEAGEGDDLVSGGAGHDVIVGDSGHDIIDGGDGNDRIFGDRALDSSSQFTGGEEGNDYIDGGAGDDVISGNGGDDTLIGGEGNDELHGGEGNDTLDGSDGDNMLFGGDGNDTLIGGAGNDQLQGGEGDDYLNGGDGNDLITGGDGNDILLGDAGNDQLQGTAGNNLLDGGEGDDLLFGGQDNDTLIGGVGNDQLQGDAGDDILDGGEGNDILFGQAGNDTVFGGTGNDQIQGGDGEDQLDGGEGDDLLFGGDGDDILVGGSGDDALLGGAGNDTLDGREGADELQGEAGDDHLNGGVGNDLLFGGVGNDHLDGGSGRDQLVGGEGNDTLNGGEEDDLLFGEAGADILDGGSGADTLNGGEGADHLNGGNDSDTLVGGIGDDILEGGLGHDQYTYEPGYGHDIITDSGAYDIVILQGGITQDDVTITEDGSDLLISLNMENSLRLVDGADAPSIEAIVFSDGSTLSHENFLTGADSGQYFNNGSVSGVNARTGTGGNDIFNIDGAVNSFEGGQGDDTYFFNQDTTALEIIDTGGNDTLVFGDGIAVDDINPQLESENLKILVGDGKIEINNWDNNHIERFIFTDGTVLDVTNFDLLINNAPVSTGTIADQVVDEDSLFNFQISQDTFVDPDNDALILSTSLVNGDPLPAWLSFDPSAGVFSGTPKNADVGSIELAVTAADTGNLSVTNTFALTVNNTNDAPVAVPDMIEHVIGDEGGGYFGSDEVVIASGTKDFSRWPAVAALSNGNFVVLSRNKDPDSQGDEGWKITGQIYDKDWSKVGNDIEIDIQTGNFITGRLTPSFHVDGLSDGGFVVVWDSLNSDFMDKSRTLIEGQRFNSEGEAAGNSFLVNTLLDGFQYSPHVTGTMDGGFFVSWDSQVGELGDSSGISGQIFDKDSNKVGSEFLINTIVSGRQNGSASTVLANGDIAVVWSTEPNTISGQIFNIEGEKVGNEFNVNPTHKRDSGIEDLSIAELSNGSFVVVWTSNDPVTGDSSFSSVSGQIFHMNGTALGDEFLVNTTTTGHQSSPQASPLANGGFIVAWDSAGPILGDPELGIVGKTYDVDGNETSEEFLLNASYDLYQMRPSLASLEDGSIISVWDTLDFTGGNAQSKSISGRRFSIVDDDESSQININVLENDIDPDLNDENNLILKSAVIQGDKGQVSIVDNQVRFDPGADFDDLPAGTSEIVTIEYIMSDSSGAVSTSTATILIRGENTPSEGTDADDVIDVITDSPVVSAGAGDDTVNVNNINVAVTIFSGEGSDEINISGTDEVTVFGDTGDDQVNLMLDSIGNSNLTFSGGEGNDTYKISGSTYNPGIISINDVNGNNTLVYGFSFHEAVPILGLGSLKITFNNNPIEIHLENFDPNDVFGGPRDIDIFEFTDAALTYEQLVAHGFDVEGTENGDTLTGTNVTDRISGFAGNDVLIGGEGDDIIEGGPGDDLLDGGVGDDTYIFNPGDGKNTIIDRHGNDQVEFGEGIDVDQLQFFRMEDDMFIHISDTDQITIKHWFSDADRRIDQFTFDNGNSITADDAEALISLNQPPVVGVGIIDQITDEDAAFSFTLATDAFIDPDAGDALTFSVLLADSSPLPDWLSFDSETQTFSGTPDNDDVGEMEIRVTATDTSGESISDTFTLTINNVNDAPVLVTGITDQVTDEDQSFSFTIPADTFADDDSIHGEVLSLSATLADGSSLPDWLSFDSETQTFSGIPDNDAVGLLEVSVTATDNSGESVLDTFTLTVNNVNDVPVLNQPIEDATAYTKQAFEYSLSAETFADPDVIHGDTLTLGAALVDGRPLPDWLQFDSGSLTFSGTPRIADYGELQILVTATDQQGAVASDTFDLHIGSQARHIEGDDRSNVLIGFHGDSLIEGHGGNDIITSLFGDDILFGGTGNDHLTTIAGENLLDGGSGNDYLFSIRGNSALRGGAGDDILRSQSGNNLFIGGKGDDQLQGGKGDDAYLFRLGDGHDHINERGGDDRLTLEGVSHDQLWLWQTGRDLNIGIIDTEDRITVEHWFGNDRNKIETIQGSSDSHVLHESQVQQLVQAMAAFDATGQGDLDVSQDTIDDMSVALAAAWETA